MFSNIFSLLTFKEKRKFYLLLIFVLVSMLLEMISIGLLIPILSFFINPEKLSIYLINYNITIDESFIFLGVLFIIFIFFVKNLFLSFFLWFQNLTTNNIRVSLSSRLFKNYLNQNYSNFIHEDFGNAVRNLRVESMRYGSLLLQLINLINEIFVIFGLLIILFLNNPDLSYIFFLIIIFSSIAYLFLTNKKIKKVGEARFSSEGKAIKYILEGLNAFREIKLRNIEEKIIKSFDEENRIYSIATTKGSFISELPKLWLEFLAVIVFVTFVLYLDLNSANRDETLITLGLLAGICFRIIPSVKKIIVSINKMKFSMPSIKELNKINSLFLSEISNRSLININFEDDIKFTDIQFKYSDEKIIFENINFKIKKGQKISIIGETGSGKTTLIDLISGLIKPTKGKITVDGSIISNGDCINWWKKISYMPQNPFIFNDTIYNNISLFEEPSKEKFDLIEKFIEIVELKQFLKLKKLDDILISDGLDISGGEKQRIGIARALFADSDLLIFDESTSALDKNTEKNIIDNILNFDKRKTIIFVTHKNYPLLKSDKIFEIRNKNIFEK